MASPRPITDPDIAKALAHPLRMRLLTLLEESVASPTELANVTGASLPRVSYHVRRLAAAGLIELVRTKQRRGAVEHYYQAVTPATITEEAWAPLPKVVKSAVATATLDHIREEINAAIAHSGFERDEVHLSRQSVTLDDTGFKELAQRLQTFIEDVRELSVESGERLKRDGGEPIDAMSIMMLFERRTEPAGTTEVVPGKASGKRTSRKRAAAR